MAGWPTDASASHLLKATDSESTELAAGARSRRMDLFCSVFWVVCILCWIKSPVGETSLTISDDLMLHCHHGRHVGPTDLSCSVVSTIQIWSKKNIQNSRPHVVLVWKAAEAYELCTSLCKIFRILQKRLLLQMQLPFGTFSTRHRYTDILLKFRVA